MTASNTTRRRPRSGISIVGIAVAIALVLAIGTGAYVVIDRLPASSDRKEVKTVVVERGPFAFTVVETGEVESSSNIEVRCEVKARGSAGTTILRVVPEGTFVQEGDFLVEIDASALELERNAQQILVHSSQAAVIQAENLYKTAQIAKTEYLEGTFRQEEQTLQSERFLSQEELRRAEQYVVYSQRLAAKGYVTELELEADRFAVDKARGDLETAQTKLKVLQDYTKRKMETQLESDIQSARATLHSSKSTFELDNGKLKDIEAQIAQCILRAPASGQVQYANKRSHRGGGEVIIEPGIQVRQGQVLIRLPDPNKMQVTAEINEARTKYVRVGMPASIVIRSVSSTPLEGRVIKVNDYPEPGGWFSSNVKKYGTTIEITADHKDLRPGLTASVEIEINAIRDVLRVPLPCVVEHGGQFYCIVETADGWKLRPVEVGQHSEKAIVIKNGLAEGERVVENPRLHRDLVTWPTLTVKTNARKPEHP